MKTVRIVYEKKGGMRFCSHLDITRFMARILRRAKLPVWYTEGFNPHLYLTFALPLPLGFYGLYEVMDIRLTDDSYDISAIPERLNSFCPDSIRFISAKEAVLKVKSVTSADYTVSFDDGGKILPKLKEYLERDTLTVLKKTKRGEEKPLEIKDKLKILSLGTDNSGDTELKINLPAGGALNINPDLILTAFFESGADYNCYTVSRTAILDETGKLFE